MPSFVIPALGESAGEVSVKSTGSARGGRFGKRSLTPGWSCLLVLVLAALRPGVARAQPPTDPRARAAFTEGLAMLRTQQFVQAMPLLEEAVRLESTATGLFNLALAYRGAGRIAAAVTTFERYLSAPEPGAPEARLRAIRDELPTLLRSVARLRIDVTPSSATVRVDGREAVMAQGELRVDPGTHVLEANAVGHAPSRREITAQAGMTMVLEVHLAPSAPVASPVPVPVPVPTPVVVAPPAAPVTATLTVEPSVPGAIVTVDGESRGSGPVTLSLPGGAHRVMVSAGGHEPWSRTLNLAPGATQRISASLEARSSRGWVLPVAIAGGAAVVTGVVIGVLAATRGTAEPTSGSWAVVREP